MRASDSIRCARSPVVGIRLASFFSAMLWAGVVLACGLAAGLGYLLTQLDPSLSGDRMAALAAGGLIAMLTNSLMPFAFERGGAQAGIWTVVGFAVAVAPSIG